MCLPRRQVTRTAENIISPPKLMQEDLTDLGSRSLQQRLQEILNAVQEGEALSFSKGIDGSGAGKAPPAAEWGHRIEQGRPPRGMKDEVRPPTWCWNSSVCCPLKGT